MTGLCAVGSCSWCACWIVHVAQAQVMCSQCSASKHARDQTSSMQQFWSCGDQWPARPLSAQLRSVLVVFGALAQLDSLQLLRLLDCGCATWGKVKNCIKGPPALSSSPNTLRTPAPLCAPVHTRPVSALPLSLYVETAQHLNISGSLGAVLGERVLIGVLTGE